MDDLWHRISAILIERISGPMKFRILMQPVMASIFAIRSGLRDAREGRTPYFWSLLSDPVHRRDMIREGWKSVGKIFILALVLDGVYQVIVQRSIVLIDVILVALILAIVPYLVLRGLVARIMGRVRPTRLGRT